MDHVLQLREVGSGPPALILHGASGPTSIDPIVEHLSQTHHVLVPTHPGWEGTTRSDDLDGVAALAGQYRDVLSERNLREVLLVGVSFGGWVAAELAAQQATEAPSRIDRLVLIDSVGFEIPGQQPRLPGPAPAGTPAGRGPSAASMAALHSFTAGLLSDPHLLQRLAATDLPTLLIWGEEDQVVTAAYGRAVAEALPQPTFVVIPHGGHLPYRESPDAVRQALDAFVQARVAWQI